MAELNKKHPKQSNFAAALALRGFVQDYSKSTALRGCFTKDKLSVYINTVNYTICGLPGESSARGYTVEQLEEHLDAVSRPDAGLDELVGRILGYYNDYVAKGQQVDFPQAAVRVALEFFLSSVLETNGYPPECTTDLCDLLEGAESIGLDYSQKMDQLLEFLNKRVQEPPKVKDFSSSDWNGYAGAENFVNPGGLTNAPVIASFKGFFVFVVIGDNTGVSVELSPLQDKQGHYDPTVYAYEWQNTHKPLIIAVCNDVIRQIFHSRADGVDATLRNLGFGLLN